MRGTTWPVISEGALLEAERHRQALGDVTPITKEDLWARAAADMSRKPYKGLGIDLQAAALQEALKELDAAQHENDALYARWAELTEKAG